MYRRAIPTRIAVFVLLITAASALRLKQSASQPPQAGATGASGEQAVVKQVVDGIMQPFLAENQAPGAIVGVSLHGHRYFFNYGKATDAVTGGAYTRPFLSIL